LIAYTRSWVSDRDDSAELGAGELALWAEAVQRAMDFRTRLGTESADTFADIAHADLQTDPVAAVARAYETIGIDFPVASQRALNNWAREHPPRRGRTDYDLARYGLTATGVQSAFTGYLDRFDVL
jgi:LPS sulfotransferase NodH